MPLKASKGHFKENDRREGEGYNPLSMIILKRNTYNFSCRVNLISVQQLTKSFGTNRHSVTFI